MKILPNDKEFNLDLNAITNAMVLKYFSRALYVYEHLQFDYNSQRIVQRFAQIFSKNTIYVV